MFVTDADTTEMLKAILNSIDEGIHVINKEGKTIYYNEIAADHDGLSMDDVIGKPLLDVFPSLSSETSTMFTVLKKAQPIYNQHQTYRNLKGKLIDTVNTTIPIIVENHVIGAVEIAKDLSRVKDLSQKLLDLQAKVNNRSIKAKEINLNEVKFHFSHIQSASPKMNKIKKQAEQAAATNSPIFVWGETGTGKELLVQAIHHASPRREKPFITQNCAAIPSSLLESILFGTTRGSFTGAVDREGLFELSHGGTLFLDEIHTLPFDLQAKLLRVLEDGIVRRVGSNKSFLTDVRIIAATNEDPTQLLADQKIRADLYYRLNVVSFHLPPLRERKEDISLLTEHFVSTYNYRFNKLISCVDKGTAMMFQNYAWPGNIRELKHVIEAAMNMVNGNEIKQEHLPTHFTQSSDSTSPQIPKIIPSLKDTVEQFESAVIKEKLLEAKGNVKHTAQLLNIPRQTLQYKIEKYDL
ncbi:sigma-54 interaction domain-containing protein [Alteribacter populi]|uniref:sigma-54 interaction domain-containing protein n=1 Tax=Alteribacter populi TaxID=2011011 RepID=UPI000BBAE3C0|nr:sigma 54-interacting transcriptional regulator [Alteribacter populi]